MATTKQPSMLYKKIKAYLHSQLSYNETDSQRVEEMLSDVQFEVDCLDILLALQRKDDTSNGSKEALLCLRRHADKQNVMQQPHVSLSSATKNIEPWMIELKMMARLFCLDQKGLTNKINKHRHDLACKLVMASKQLRGEMLPFLASQPLVSMSDHGKMIRFQSSHTQTTTGMNITDKSCVGADKSISMNMSSLQQFTSPTKRKGVNVGLREMSAWLLLCKEHLVERGFLSSSLHPKNTFTSSPSYEPYSQKTRERPSSETTLLMSCGTKILYYSKNLSLSLSPKLINHRWRQ